jgi:hypothetical protein
VNARITWLRRTITVGAVAFLSAIGMATASAGASSDAAQAGVPATDIGIQVWEFTQFAGSGCTYRGEGGTDGSGTPTVATSVIGGSNCPRPMVQAHICSGDNCWTTEWHGAADSVVVRFPTSYRLVSSFHKCSNCTLTFRIPY